MQRIITPLAMLLAAMMLVVACNKDDNDNMAGESQVNIRLTDAPAAYVAIYVDIQGVEISTDQGWVTANVNAGIYNLLDYREGLDTLIASTTINATRVQQVRLVLGSNNSIVVGPATFPLETPSAEQSGLKLNVQMNVQPGETYTILLDFDAAKSIVETGNGGYKLKPVIRTILEANNGIIIGDLGATAAGSLVYAIDGTDTVGTVANSVGHFYIGGLASGTYEVYIDAVLPYEDETVTNVNVSSGQTTNLGNIVLTLQ